MAKAKKLPSGMWRVQASFNGERRSFTDFTAKGAELQALEWQAGKKKGRNPDNVTVADALERYISARENILSPTTATLYRRYQQLYFKSINHIKVSKLTADDVQREINDLAATLSPKTIRNIYGLLRAATEIDFKIALPQKKKPKTKTPTIEEIKAILEKTKGTTIEVPVLLALWCGLRMSEIRGLRWDHVYPDRIVIDRAIVDVDGVPTLKGTKTEGSERVVEISPYLYQKIQQAPHTSEYVVTMSGKALYHKFVRTTGNICRFHDLRHANASVMMMLGVPDNVAMERGGWETESIYKKTYADIFDEERKKANQKIDAFFEDINAHENAHEVKNDLLQ